MKTLAKYHECNHCVIGEKKMPVRYRDFRETGPRYAVKLEVMFTRTRAKVEFQRSGERAWGDGTHICQGGDAGLKI